MWLLPHARLSWYNLPVENGLLPRVHYSPHGTQNRTPKRPTLCYLTYLMVLIS